MAEEKIIKKTTAELLGFLGFPESEIKVLRQEEGYLVDIKVSNQGVLIGYHGETINALQLILSLLVYKKQGEWQSLLVDIGGYRQERREKLEDMATKAAQKVKFSQKPLSLTGLKPFERRVIHLCLADDPQVFTESEGESEDRVLIIYPKKTTS